MAGAGLYEVGPGKTYTTIQSALDQLWTDQGSAEFAASQFIRIFADTYDENVTPNAGLNPSDSEGFTLVIEGDPSDSRANIIVAPSSGDNAIRADCDNIIVRHMTINGGSLADHVIESSSAMVMATVDDVNITATPSGKAGLAFTNALVVRDSVITTAAGNGVVGSTVDRTIRLERCLIQRTGGRGGFGCQSYGGIIATGCVIMGFNQGMYGYGESASIDARNCTIYDCAQACRLFRATQSDTVFLDNIVHSIDYVLYFTCAPDETSDTFAGPVTLRNNCWYNYATNFAYAGAAKTYAQFVAFDRVDASGDLDATDPLLTNPGGDDFSLQSTSPCRHAGHGSGVVSDAEGTAYDTHHPDIGAISTGALTVAVPAIASIADDKTGNSITLSLSADNVLDVLTVLYRRRLEIEWTTFGTTRTGSGTLQVTGLERNQNYVFIVVTERGGEISRPSHAEQFTVLPPRLYS